MDLTLSSQLEHHGQQHVLQFWSELTAARQDAFVRQLAQIDWNLVDSFSPNSAQSTPGSAGSVGTIAPPTHVVRKPQNEAEFAKWQQARQLGELALRQGKVGAVLLAGGQGSRLGSAQPKGMFPIGPVSQKSLFEILAEQIVALSDRYGHAIPYLLMTSDGTHDDTVAYFEQHDCFGLDRSNLFFFQQGYAPSLDSQTGKLLLSEKGVLSMSPDGHGGLLTALRKAGLFEELRRRGVEYLFSHQVDNPLVKACDPEFIGLHIQHGADVSTKVVTKTGPEEKVGVAVDVDGRTAIIEYSDLPSSFANEREINGELRFWAGSTAIHLFCRSFLEYVATSTNSLPWHRAVKKIPYVDRQGRLVQPEKENGIKFERFLFDTLPLAKTALIVETKRAEEFAPLKNSTGDFSPEYVRNQMTQVAANWLKQAGMAVPVGAIIEISPRYALSAEDLIARKNELLDLNWNHPVYLGPSRALAMNIQLQDAKRPHVKSKRKTIEPLIFEPFYRPQVWGGRGLQTQLGRRLPEAGPYGEAWELSPQKLHVSRVTEGSYAGHDLNDLWTNCRPMLSGNTGPDNFPLLIKWLECHELLSLQVHPDDQMAQRVLGEPFGKSEAWVVVSVEPTARIFAGLKPGITRADVVAHINAGTLVECLHSFVPAAGDCISIPAGTIHAAGGGMLVAEVQQSSDATFRLFDWNRLGLDGVPRALQVERALEAVNWDQGPISPVIPREIHSECGGVRAEHLVDSPSFRMERYQVRQSFPSPHHGEMTIWMVLDGKARLSDPVTDYRHEFIKGATTVIPAAASDLVWESLDSQQPLTLLCTRPRHPQN